MAFLSPFLPCLRTKLFPLKPTSKSSDPCLLLSIPITSTMSWSCKKCTFINPPSSSSKPTCQICLSPPSPAPLLPSSNQETPKWSCKACTFLNSYKNTNCEICGTRASVCSLSGLEDLNGLDDGDLDSSVGSVFLPLGACKRKDRDPVERDQDGVEMGRFRGFKSLNNAKDGGEGNSMGLGGFQGFRASNKSVTVLKGERDFYGSS